MEVNYFTILYWFCHTSTWICHRYTTCSPSWIPLPPPSPCHPSGSSQCTSPKHPVSFMEPGLVIRYFLKLRYWKLIKYRAILLRKCNKKLGIFIFSSELIWFTVTKIYKQIQRKIFHGMEEIPVSNMLLVWKYWIYIVFQHLESHEEIFFIIIMGGCSQNACSHTYSRVMNIFSLFLFLSLIHLWVTGNTYYSSCVLYQFILEVLKIRQ